MARGIAVGAFTSGLVVACSSGEFGGDDTLCAPLTLNIPSDTRPDAGCEVLLTRGARSVRVEMRSSPTCDAKRCEVTCQSPDLSLAFTSCTRAPKGSAFGFTLAPQSQAELQSWFGGARGDVATVTVTCGGDVVWVGMLPLCIVPA